MEELSEEESSEEETSEEEFTEEEISDFFHAAKRGEYSDLRRFLKAGFDVNARDDEGNAALHLASGLGGCDYIVHLLLQNGADVNAVNDFGQTPLHIFCLDGIVKIGELLVEYGANLNSRDNLDSLLSMTHAGQVIPRLSIS